MPLADPISRCAQLEESFSARLPHKPTTRPSKLLTQQQQGWSLGSCCVSAARKYGSSLARSGAASLRPSLGVRGPPLGEFRRRSLVSCFADHAQHKLSLRRCRRLRLPRLLGYSAYSPTRCIAENGALESWCNGGAQLLAFKTATAKSLGRTAFLRCACSNLGQFASPTRTASCHQEAGGRLRADCRSYTDSS